MKRKAAISALIDAAQVKSDPVRQKLEDENARLRKLVKYDAITELKREVATLKKAAEKRETTMDLVRAAVNEALEDLPTLSLPPVKFPARKKEREEIPCLHVSDTQVGKVTTTYNSKVAETRLMLLADKTLEVIDVRRSAAHIEELRLYLGGDINEGEDIFPGQAHTIDQSVFDQACRTSPLMFARMILRLLGPGGVKRIRIKTVPGNHGRNGRNGAGQHPRTNWDNVTYHVLKTMLLGYDGNPRPELAGRLEIDVSDDFYAVDRVYKWGNLIVHGHQIRGGFAGFPFYGTAKKAWGWIDSIEEAWDYLWFGHFHTPMSGTLNRRIFLANGTTESDNTYAKEELSAAGYPCQRLSFFNEKHGLISDGMIYLDDARRPNATRLALQSASA
jgi:hypothetical protein